MSLLSALALAIAAGVQAPPEVPTAADLEAEVLANVRGQPLGEGTVADLELPDAFLRRVADRVVRASFEERYRIVVDSTATPGATGPPRGSAGARSSGTALTIGVAVALLVIVAVAVSVASRRGGARPA